MSDVVVRKAILADAPDLVTVIDAAYAPFRDAGLDLPPVSDGVATAIDTMSVWVATIDNHVVGGVMARLQPKPYIMNLAVHPNAGGAGVGSLLIKTVVAVAGQSDASEIALVTHKDMVKTQAFYARLGWVETGREGNKVYMVKQLKSEG